MGDAAREARHQQEDDGLPVRDEDGGDGLDSADESGEIEALLVPPAVCTTPARSSTGGGPYIAGSGGAPGGYIGPPYGMIAMCGGGGPTPRAGRYIGARPTGTPLPVELGSWAGTSTVWPPEVLRCGVGTSVLKGAEAAGAGGGPA